MKSLFPTHIAVQVLPIMRKRGWKVQHLCEFYPNNPNLLGKKETNIAFERLYAHA